MTERFPQPRKHLKDAAPAESPETKWHDSRANSRKSRHPFKPVWLRISVCRETNVPTS